MSDTVDDRWGIVGKWNGLFSGQWLTRRQAIAAHVKALDGVGGAFFGSALNAEQWRSWRKYYRMGHRAVRLTITYEYKP